MNQLVEKFKNFLKDIYQKIVMIDDSPQRIALGFGVGVFLGIFPGAGPIAALTLAVIFHINKAAALLGSLLTNTWLSIVTFVFAVKVGSFVTGNSWVKVYDQCKFILKDFHLNDIFNVSMFEIFKPLMMGYVIVAFLIGAASYFIVLAICLLKQKKI